MSDSIFLELRKLANLMHRALCVQRQHFQDCDNATHIQMCVLRFLNEAKGDIYQRDIEKEFSIRRSTATILLQNLEEKGLIYKQNVESDARLKQIILTQKAKEFHRKMKQYADSFEQMILDGISAEEQQEFIKILEKMADNFDKISTKIKQKEKEE